MWAWPESGFQEVDLRFCSPRGQLLKIKTLCCFSVRKSRAGVASYFHICCSCVILVAGHIFGKWYLLRYHKNLPVCVHTVGKATEKGGPPAPSWCKGSQPVSPCPLGQYLSSWDDHFCPQGQARARIWNCLPPGAKQVVEIGWMGASGNRKAYAAPSRRSAATRPWLSECCHALALPNIFIFSIQVRREEFYISIFKNVGTNSNNTQKTKNKTVRGKQNTFGTSGPCFHPRKVDVLKISELYFKGEKWESRLLVILLS